MTALGGRTRAATSMFVAACVLFLSACGGTFYPGQFLSASPVDDGLVRSASSAVTPKDREDLRLIPVQVRTYPRHYVVVDVLVLATDEEIAALRNWVGFHGRSPTDEDKAAWIAQVRTNGLHMGGDRQIAIRRAASGEPLRLSRRTFEHYLDAPEAEDFGLVGLARVRSAAVELEGRTVWASVIPVTLETATPPAVGEGLEVTIDSGSRRSSGTLRAVDGLAKTIGDAK